MGTNTPFMVKNSAFSPYRLFRREIGLPTPIGAGDAMARSLYCGMKPIASWDCEQANTMSTGGVFNLEFSPEGNLLVAACEKKSIQIFDPLTHQRIHSVNSAHSDCVNCVKFLDGRMFATCSDDTTIALWDVRNLTKKIRSLSGHSNWVKNIEFSVKDKLLVTSGLDGSIYTWDINSYTEYNLVYQRVFHASGLMRCRLSPDARQMVMCTTGGLLVIIHDLNLATLAQDLHGFKPNLYRLMQMSQQLIPIAAMYEHLFDQKRKENRVEFVSDFPEGNDAEVVSALQIHPQGWTALSRNISHDDRSEWSCIHDIQPEEPVPDKSTRDTSLGRGAGRGREAGRGSGRGAGREEPPVRRRRRAALRPRHRSYRIGNAPAEGANESVPAPGPSAQSGSPSAQGSTSPATTEHPLAPLAPQAPVAPRLAAQGLSSIQNDVWEASITIRQHRLLQDMTSRGQIGRNFNMQRIMGINTGIAPPPAPRARPARPARVQLSAPAPAPAPAPANARQLRPIRLDGRPLEEDENVTSTSPSTSGQTPRRAGAGAGGSGGGGGGGEGSDTASHIRQNKNRLLYYVEETNEGKGFIKELCYSADGRLVCSPFGRGMRLLALNENCSELSQCVQEFKGPTTMVDVGQSMGIHQDLVVSSKFSPRYHLLVTGCLEGKIVWYEPYSGERMY